VLNDQQMNMPHFMSRICSARTSSGSFDLLMAGIAE
jgi:hypothetical protein